MLLWLWSWTGTVLEQWCEVLVFKLNCFHDYFIWTWVVITLNRTLMYDVVFVNWCNMWHVCWIMYDLGCMLMVNRDPSWYSMDYRVYMGSSMIVWPLAGCHCTCALINWMVLLQVWLALLLILFWSVSLLYYCETRECDFLRTKNNMCFDLLFVVCIEAYAIALISCTLLFVVKLRPGMVM